MEGSQAVCPACGATADASPLPIPDYEYGLEYLAHFVECECKTLFQLPMPSEAELSHFYPESYHAAVGQGALGRVRNELRLRHILTVSPDFQSLLDFGCGNGAFLLHAAQRFPERAFYGFEIAPRREVVELAGGRLRIFRGDFDWLLRELPPCAVITMNHVIEHVPDPRAVVAALADRLVPGGVLEGQTPASDSLERRVFGARWSGFHAPRHTVVFSRRGLQHLLDANGYVAVKIGAAFNPAAIAVSFASLTRRRRGGIVRRAGIGWYLCLGLACVLAPVDLAFGAGVVDFEARKPTS
jgi:SAM-dependent methyltransferase